jgi:release factor glutamine methyltransferase
MTLSQAISAATARGLERLDAQWLLLHALGIPTQNRAWLLTNDTNLLTLTEQVAFEAVVQRRLSGEPLAYITGTREFFGLALNVDARVLDPRPDTETLVEWALDVLPVRMEPVGVLAPIHILDLGTGSGAIALALKHTRNDVQVTAVDASPDALDVASANALRLKLEVAFIQSQWLNGVSGHYHLIVSNPPYIAAADPHLAALHHEPLQALASGADGLDDIRQIIIQARTHLHPGGWLLLEHGYDQAEPVRTLLRAAGFAQVQSRQDLSGIERCSGGAMSLLFIGQPAHP